MLYRKDPMCRGMSKKAPRIYNPAYVQSMSKKKIFDSIFYDESFTFLPKFAIIGTNWRKEWNNLSNNDLCVCGSGICRLYGTSFSYGYCDDISKKIKGWFGYRKKALLGGMAGIKYDDFLQEDIDIWCENNRLIILKPAPVLFWLANDALYETEYRLSVTRPKSEFLKYVVR